MTFAPSSLLAANGTQATDSRNGTSNSFSPEGMRIDPPSIPNASEGILRRSRVSVVHACVSYSFSKAAALMLFGCCVATPHLTVSPRVARFQCCTTGRSSERPGKPFSLRKERKAAGSLYCQYSKGSSDLAAGRTGRSCRSERSFWPLGRRFDIPLLSPGRRRLGTPPGEQLVHREDRHKPVLSLSRHRTLSEARPGDSVISHFSKEDRLKEPQPRYQAR